MIKRLLVAASAFALCTTGCVKEITSEERLERETQKSELKESLGAKDLQKIKCDDTSANLAKARNENKSETERVNDYIELYESLKSRSAKFDEAMNRNPDLAYRKAARSSSLPRNSAFSRSQTCASSSNATCASSSKFRPCRKSKAAPPSPSRGSTSEP